MQRLWSASYAGCSCQCDCWGTLRAPATLLGSPTGPTTRAVRTFRSGRSSRGIEDRGIWTRAANEARQAAFLDALVAHGTATNAMGIDPAVHIQRGRDESVDDAVSDTDEIEVRVTGEPRHHGRHELGSGHRGGSSLPMMPRVEEAARKGEVALDLPEHGDAHRVAVAVVGKGARGAELGMRKDDLAALARAELEARVVL